MRIHSARPGSLYRRRPAAGDRRPPLPPPAIPTSRILRLGVVVAVLLLVMFRASQPGVYAPLLGDRWFEPANAGTSTVIEPTKSTDRHDLSDDARERVETVSQLIDDGLDGTVWRAADRPGLLAALQLHRELAMARQDRSPTDRELRRWFDAAPAAGVIALLQQPGAYRGTAVTAAGQVASATRIDGVYHLWLRPDDGSDRPWLTIVPQLPLELMPLVDREIAPPLPKVVVAGTYIKRLAYESAAGAELTPVVAGHIARFAAGGNALVEPALPAGATPAAAPPPSQSGGVVVWSIVAAVAAGVLLAAWLQWSAVASRRRSIARRHESTVQLP